MSKFKDFVRLCLYFFLIHCKPECVTPSVPFFLEGESVCWLFEGVEVVTLDGRTSGGSAGVKGLTDVTVLMLDRLSGVTVVTGVRGSGLTMVHTEGPPSSFSVSVSFAIASELRMTRKWVFSDGVMVTVLSGSSFSFLVT